MTKVGENSKGFYEGFTCFVASSVLALAEKSSPIFLKKASNKMIIFNKTGSTVASGEDMVKVRSL